MKSTLILLVLAVCALASDVIELDHTNFDQVIKENNLILVEFYAPWCGHCKKLAPEYEKAAQELKGIAPLAKINADEESNRPLSGLYGIRGFPTLKVFRKNGEVISDYEGERSASAIVSFMKRQSRPAVTTLTSSDEVTALSTQDKVVIVGFFDDESSEEASKFRQVADLLRNKFLFGELIGNADVAKTFGLEATPGVILFKSFDERKNVLSKDQFADLESFISTYSVPLVDEIGPENYRTYAESPLPLVYLFVDLTVEGQKDTYLDIVNSIAQGTKGKLNWVYIDWSKYARHAESLGLSGKTVPALAIEEMKEGLHYAFDEKQEITKESVSEWTNQFLNKELQPTIKSEEIPESNDGPVKILVAKNFDQIVYDNTKDVLVEFYAPWCGHCKKLAPTFEELGKFFQDQANVVIAKIDATANDINKKHGVRGFPTLKFFPAGDKENPIDYNGDRSLEDLKTFITGHTSKSSEPAHQKDEL